MKLMGNRILIIPPKPAESLVATPRPRELDALQRVKVAYVGIGASNVKAGDEILIDIRSHQLVTLEGKEYMLLNEGMMVINFSD